jgi:hypothetical protein
MIVCTTTFIAAEEKPIGSIEDFSELTIPSSDDPIQVGRILGLLGGEPQQGNLGIVLYGSGAIKVYRFNGTLWHEQSRGGFGSKSGLLYVGDSQYGYGEKYLRERMDGPAVGSVKTIDNQTLTAIWFSSDEKLSVRVEIYYPENAHYFRTKWSISNRTTSPLTELDFFQFKNSFFGDMTKSDVIDYGIFHDGNAYWNEIATELGNYKDVNGNRKRGFTRAVTPVHSYENTIITAINEDLEQKNLRNMLTDDDPEIGLDAYYRILFTFLQGAYGGKISYLGEVRISTPGDNRIRVQNQSINMNLDNYIFDSLVNQTFDYRITVNFPYCRFVKSYLGFSASILIPPSTKDYTLHFKKNPLTPYVDEADALQWKKDTLEPGESWNIITYDGYIDSPVQISSLGSISCQAGNSCPLTYSVKNISDAAQSIQLRLQADYNAEIKGTEQFVLQSQQEQLISVRVDIPSEVKNGSLIDVVLLDDLNNSSDVGTIIVSIPVQEGNTKPVLTTELNDHVIVEKENFSFQIPDVFQDVDDDTLTYRAVLLYGTALPDWLNFSPVTRTFSGKVSSLVEFKQGIEFDHLIYMSHFLSKVAGKDFETDRFIVKVIADDGNGGQAQGNFEIILTEVNDPPQITVEKFLVKDEDSSAFVLPLNPSDDENDPYTITATSSDENKASVIVQEDNLLITPVPDANGDVSFDLTIEDAGQLSSNVSITLTLISIEDPPYLPDIGDVSMYNHLPAIKLPVSATDPDGDAVTFSVTNSDPVKATVSLDNQYLVINPASPGQTTINLTAKDTKDNQTTETFVITVIEPEAQVALNGRWKVLTSDTFDCWNLNAIDLSKLQIVFRDINNDGKATVKIFNKNSETWEIIGSEGFSDGKIDNPRIINDASGNTIVAYQDDSLENRIVVKKYNQTTETWTDLGNGPVSSAFPHDFDIEIGPDNQLYIAYYQLWGARESRTISYSESDNDWYDIGENIAEGTTLYLDLEIDSDCTLYVVYQDESQGKKATLKTYENGTWALKGNPGFTSGVASHLDLEINDLGQIFLLFQDGDNFQKSSVCRLNGNAWDMIGNTGFSENSIDQTDFIIDQNGYFYAMYRDCKTFETFVSTYDKTNDNWKLVGTGNIGYRATLPAIEFDTDGQMYAAFVDQVQMQCHLVVTKYDPYYVNHVPVAGDSIDDQNATEDQLFTWQVSSGLFNDADNDPFTYQLTLDNGDPLPTWLKFYNQSLYGKFENETQRGSGTLELKLIADDGNGGIASQLFTLTLTAVNDAPVIQNIPTQVSEEEVAFTVTVSDEENDDITYAIALGSEADDVSVVTMQIDQNGNVSLNPHKSGQVTIAVTATDSKQYSTTERFTFISGGAGVWTPLPNPLPLGVNVVNALRIASDGTLYMSYSLIENLYINDVFYRTYRPIVKKFDGTNWVDVGTYLNDFKGYNNVMTIDSQGNIFHVNMDQASPNMEHQIKVKKWDGNNWVDVGNLSGFTYAFSDFTLSPQDIPYISIKDNTNNTSIYKFDGTNWQNLTTADLYLKNILADSNEYIYASYILYNPDSVGVKRFDGTSWSDLGNITLDPEWKMKNIILRMNSQNVPYVAIHQLKILPPEGEDPWICEEETDLCTFYDQTIFLKYDGSNWVNVGSPIDKIVSNIEISNQGTVYIKYNDGSANYVKKFNGTDWEDVGSKFGNYRDIENGFAIDSDETLYVLNAREGDEYFDVSKFEGVSNYAPRVAKGIGSLTATEGVLFSLQLDSDTFIDPDDDTLTFRASLSNDAPLPAWLSFNAQSHTFSGIPGVNDVLGGSIEIKVTAADNVTGEVSTNFTIYLIPTTETYDIVLAFIEDIFIEEDSSAVDIALYGLNAAGDNLTYSATSSDTSIAAVAVSNTTLTVLPVANANGCITITVEATDGNIYTQTSFILTVLPIEDYPVLDALPDVSKNEGARPFDVTLHATDGDQDLISYTAYSSDPDKIRLMITNNLLQVIPETGAIGDIPITVTAIDQNGYTDTKSFTLTLNDVENTPVLNTLRNMNAIEDDGVLTITMTAVDGDGDTITYSATSSDTMKASVSVVDNVLTLTPLQDGTVTIHVTAKDSKENADNESFTLTIADVNDAPVLDPIDNQTKPEDSNAFTLSVSATDEENDNITLSAVSSDTHKATVSISEGNTLTVIPVENAYGDVDITITAMDSNNAKSTQTFTLSLIEVEDQPTLEPIENQIINEDAEAFQVNVDADDFDGDILTVNAESDRQTIVDVLIFDNELYVVPQKDASGTATIQVAVSDPKGNTALQNFDVILNDVQDPPELNPIENQTIEEDALPISFILKAKDADGDTISYTATSSDESIATVEINEDLLIVLPVVDACGKTSINIIGDDGNGNQVNQAFSVTLTCINDAPIFDEIEPVTLDEDADAYKIELIGLDVEGDAFAYSMVSIGSNIFNAILADENLTITPIANAYGTGTVEVFITDSYNASYSQSFTVTVNSVEDIPILTGIDNQTIREDGFPFYLPLNAMDGDGDPISYSVVSSDTSKASVSVTDNVLRVSNVVNAYGTVDIQVIAKDPKGNSDTKSFTFTIFPNIFTVCPSGCDYTSIVLACDDSFDSMQIKVLGGTYPEGSLNIAKAITVSTAETSDPVTIVVDDLIVSDQTIVLLNSQTIISVAENITNNGTISYDSCSPRSVIIFDQTGDKTFKSNDMIVCHMIIDKHSGITAVDSLSIAGSLTVLNGDFTNGSAMTVNHWVIHDSVYLGNQTTITGDLLITENGKLDAQAASIRIAGDWCNNGTFIPQASQITFNGQTQQVISSSDLSKQHIFNDFILNGASIKLKNDLVILNNLSIITGILDANDQDIFTGGNWSNDANFVHSNRTVYLNASNGDKTLAQTDNFYNMTIGISGGHAIIRLLSSITIENNLRIMSGTTMDLNANNLTIGHQFTNQGYFTANGGITAFSRLNRANSPAYIHAAGARSSFNDVVMVCEPGAKWMAVNEFTVDGNLTIDGCVLHANYLDYSGELTTINGGSIIKFTSVPNLNEWGIILFIGLLGIFGVMRLRIISKQELNV